MPYPFYSNNQYYMQDLQSMRDKIDRQMQQMQQMQQLNQNQMQNQPVPTNLTQNFQIAPTTNNNNELESKYANNIDEVKNTFVMKTGVFVNKDFTAMWIKDVAGNVRTFKTEEVIEMDEKDKEIYALRKQVEEMKGMIQNAYANESNNTNFDDTVAEQKSSRVSSRKPTNAK